MAAMPLTNSVSPHGVQLDGSGYAIERSRIDEYRAHHVVTARKVGKQLRQQVPMALHVHSQEKLGDAVIRQVPQVMVRITDDQIRLKNLLVRFATRRRRSRRRYIRQWAHPLTG